MFSGSLIAASLQATMLSKGTRMLFVVGPDMPEEPDLLGVVTLLPGLGLTLEGIADNPFFQVVIRGEPEGPDLNSDGPLLIATQVDQAICNGSYPHSDWGDYVVGATRTGGRPARLGPADDARRITYTCTYIATIIPEAV